MATQIISQDLNVVFSNKGNDKTTEVSKEKNWILLKIYNIITGYTL